MHVGHVGVTDESGAWPSLNLPSEMRMTKLAVPRTICGIPAACSNFEPYYWRAVVQNHILAGHNKNLIEMWIFQLNKIVNWIDLTSFLRANLKSPDCPSQTQEFITRCKKLNDILLLLICGIIILIPLLLRSVGYTQVICADNILQLFSQLMALTLWWPKGQIDEENAVQ